MHHVKSFFERTGPCHWSKARLTQGCERGLGCHLWSGWRKKCKPKIVQLDNAQAFSYSTLPWNPVQSVNIQPQNAVKIHITGMKIVFPQTFAKTVHLAMIISSAFAFSSPALGAVVCPWDRQWGSPQKPGRTAKTPSGKPLEAARPL